MQMLIEIKQVLKRGTEGQQKHLNMLGLVGALPHKKDSKGS